MVIAICQFGNETNTFASGRTDFKMLSPGGWVKSDEVVEKFGKTNTYLGGALQAIYDAGEKVLPIDLVMNNGNFGAGPLMLGECAEYVMDTICARFKEQLGNFDGIYFAIHGAGCCEFDEDLEGYTLRRLREVVGPDIPIMCSLDLHANMTEEMVALTNGLFSIKEVPHTDCYDAAYLATKYLIQYLRGQVHPVVALRRLPLLISPVKGSTLTGPGKQVKEYFAAYCKEHGLLDCAFVHGFSATDRSCSSSAVLVVADGCSADAYADQLAAYVWSLREDFVKADVPDAAGAIDAALKAPGEGYVIVNEASDNPGSGGPGDATHLLREMLRRDLPRTIMGPIFDPETAEQVHKHHVGDRISIRLGGKTIPVAGEPLELEGVEILNLSDGRFVSAAPINRGVPMCLGKSARLRKGNVEFIVVSVRYQTLDDRSFLMTGADLSQYRIVGLKSMNHFRGYFTPLADAIITADTPGVRPANLALYPYKHVTHPIYPLDKDVVYNGKWPVAE